MSEIKYVWIVTYQDRTITNIDYYTSISKVRKLKHLLVCAGYNEDNDNELFQTWVSPDGCKSFVFSREIADLELLKKRV